MLVLGLPFALAALIGLTVAAAQRPQRAVLLLAALAPFDGLLRIVPHPGFVEGWKEGLVLLALAATFVAPPTARGAPGRALPVWLLPAAGMGLLALASALVVGGVQGVQGMKIGFFYLLLFWTIWRCPLTGTDRDRLMTILLGLGMVTAAWGVVQQIAGPPLLLQLGYEYNTDIRFAVGLLRSFSTFNQPFPFGLFLTMVMLIGLPVSLNAPSRRRSVAYFCGLPLLIAGLISSTVRSAMLGLAVGVLFLAFQRHRGLAHLVPAAAAALLLVPVEVYRRLLSSASLRDRTGGWEEMRGVIMSNPVGVGIGSTGSTAEKTADLGGGAASRLVTARWSSGYQPDNYYIKTLLELGPLGLWLLVLLLVSCFMAARKLSTVRGADGALARGVAASIAAAAAASFVSTYFEIFPMDLYFWLLIGVLATLPHQPAADGARVRIRSGIP